ncbi:MAG TPA: phosphodiester glycosidase family protein [Pyrinomonadaceae bacterium]|nr:phosphodiester glycosidase family protein [Pyrinomonadaceae bacterium]
MRYRKLLIFAAEFLLVLSFSSCASKQDSGENFAAFIVDPTAANIKFFWQDDEQKVLGSIGNLKKYVECSGQKLHFAMNGGMFMENRRPLGLYIEDGKTLAPLNTRESAEGNFYLQPNGVFYIRADRRAFVVPTRDFKDDKQIKYATQSGPMLVLDGEINQAFKPDSTNLNIRNGVCVTRDEHVVFAISRREVNFYDFAEYFKKLGCRNALFLDGFVSRMYAPEQNIAQTDGDFGVIIGITD